MPEHSVGGVLVNSSRPADRLRCGIVRDNCRRRNGRLQARSNNSGTDKISGASAGLTSVVQPDGDGATCHDVGSADRGGVTERDERPLSKRYRPVGSGR
jgi:hypothetical protein